MYYPKKALRIYLMKYMEGGNFMEIYGRVSFIWKGILHRVYLFFTVTDKTAYRNAVACTVSTIKCFKYLTTLHLQLFLSYF